jgi:hypothetical protein
MPKTQEIKVTITPDGQVQIEVNGETGMNCLALTQELEALLGGEVTERKLKPEAFQQANQAQTRTIRQRTGK